MKLPKCKHYIDLDGVDMCDLGMQHLSHICGILGLHFKKEDCKKWNGHFFTKKGSWTKDAIKKFKVVVDSI